MSHETGLYTYEVLHMRLYHTGKEVRSYRLIVECGDVRVPVAAGHFEAKDRMHEDLTLILGYFTIEI